ncbi:MAG TPA: response regulator transcription factor [Micromonosporaceae bacterium]|nr:response regulator transcription factor [Micromonosporaceae bacterium]
MTELIDEALRPDLLIVEDDGELRDMLARLLDEAGYRSDGVGDGHRGLHQALTRPYAGMIIDRGLPAVDGLDLIRRLRGRGIDAPILILTAYGAVSDTVAGLDAGADDYLVKPFEIDELLARVRAMMRRHHASDLVISIGAGKLNVATRTAWRADGREVELSGREATLLQVLIKQPGRVHSRDELRTRVFRGTESASIVDTYVHYLRRKLGSKVIETVRGIGYRIGEM